MDLIYPNAIGAVALSETGAIVDIHVMQWEDEEGLVLCKRYEVALTVKHIGDALLLGGDCFPGEPLRVPLRRPD